MENEDAQLLLQLQSQLGEGAIWNAATQKLYWVDIEGRLFHVYDPVGGENQTFDVAKRVGTVVPAGNNKVLLALEDGIAEFDLDTARLDYKIATDIHKDLKRFNDGKCDSRGRFWVGSMSLHDLPGQGALYCIGNDFQLNEKISEVSISNGIVWNGDDDVMYYIDTPTRQIAKFDFDAYTGSISNKEVVITVPASMGYPDGMAIDSEGMLWIALWDGFGVGRFDPRSGNLLQKINLPVPKVTSCAFGGNDFKTLYITTARVEMSPAELEKYPLSGSLFKIDTQFVGLPAYHFNH